MPQELMHTPHVTPPVSQPPVGRGRRTRGRAFGRQGKLALAGALVLLVLLGAAGPAAAWTSEYAFTVTGHGWGHGVGMSQWGAYGYAKNGWKYDKILKHYYTGITLAKYGNPTIRVNLRSGQKSFKVTCPKKFTVQGGSGAKTAIPAGRTATVTYVASSKKYRVVAGTITRTYSAAPVFRPTAGALRVVTKTDFGTIGAFRGVIKVLYTGGGLMMINHIPLEYYLRGVVPHEVSPSWPAEAIKAQACAARAFTLRSRQGTSRAWDVYTDVRSQAYGGVGSEDSRTTKAVTGTAGVCPSYKGQPIQAFYFSSSGGRTENSENVWTAPVAYLKSVADPYDTYATRHDWGPLRPTQNDITKKLKAAASVRAVVRVKRGKSERTVTAALITSQGASKPKYVPSSTLRSQLGLYSTWVTFKSMGIIPAAKDAASVKADDPDDRITLNGRVYPELAEGTAVTLHYYRGGAWKTLSVKTTRKSENLPKSTELPNGYTVYYSTYEKSVKPPETTKYYFSHGTAKSPTTTITVK